MTYWIVNSDGEIVGYRFEFDVPIREIYGMDGSSALVDGVDFGRTQSPERLQMVAKAAAKRRKDYYASIHACRSEIDQEYYDDMGGGRQHFTRCGHSPKEHNAHGCCEHVIGYSEGVDWDDWGGPIYCACDSYTKPAPLMILDHSWFRIDEIV